MHFKIYIVSFQICLRMLKSWNTLLLKWRAYYRSKFYLLCSWLYVLIHNPHRRDWAPKLSELLGGHDIKLWQWNLNTGKEFEYLKVLLKRFWVPVSLTCLGPAGWRLSALWPCVFHQSFMKVWLVVSGRTMYLLTEQSDLEEAHSSQCPALTSMKSLGRKTHIWRDNRGKASVSKSRLDSCHQACDSNP